MARILVTNDDGIGSPGLHVLAQTLSTVGEVVIVAPDREFSGASASIGALLQIRPTARRADVSGVAEAWALSATPALCVILGRFGLFGDIDLVVSGINPGVNAGRSVYHSGTVGAALTARNAGVSGIAVSQHAAGFEFNGQQLTRSDEPQRWSTAATVATTVAAAVLDEPHAAPAVINLNVPNLELDQLTGWRHTPVGDIPMRALGSATLAAEAGADGSFPIAIAWGFDQPPDDGTDEGAITRGEVAMTYLSRFHAEARTDLAAVDAALSGLTAALG